MVRKWNKIKEVQFQCYIIYCLDLSQVSDVLHDAYSEFSNMSKSSFDYVILLSK